jgi:hypothetical protein
MDIKLPWPLNLVVRKGIPKQIAKLKESLANINLYNNNGMSEP